MEPTSQPIAFSPTDKTSKKTSSGVILCLIVSILLAIGGIGFAVYEINQNNQLAKELAEATSHSDEEEVREENSDDNILRFSWFDFGEPGNTYAIEISGNLTYKNQPGCSTVECLNGEYYPEPTIYKSTLPFDVLEKVVKIYPLLDFESSRSAFERDSDQELFTSGIIEFLKAEQEFSCTFKNETTTETISYCRDIEKDVDGKITTYEHGRLLIDHLYKKLVEKS